MNLRAAALAALCSSAPLAAASVPLPPPDGTLRAAEAALRAGDGDALAALAPRDGRVLVDLAAPRRVRGSFGPGQLAVVAQHLFKAVSTAAFAFDPADRHVAGSTVFARGRWLWRDRGDESSVTLVMTLEWRSSAWRLVELRSTP